MLANIVAGVGFALVLVAASEFSGGITGWRGGLFWGLAGFVACTLAPGLGLPPELPAMPAAELLPRQIWWIGTVAATSTGLAMIFLGKSPLFAILGVAFLVLPHLVGAPQPETFESPVPDAPAPPFRRGGDPHQPGLLVAARRRRRGPAAPRGSRARRPGSAHSAEFGNLSVGTTGGSTPSVLKSP